MIMRRLTRKDALIAILVLVVMWFGLWFANVYAQPQPQQPQEQEQEVIHFRLYGNHSEYSVSETLEALNWTLTIFQPLNNNTILVEAIKQ
jgi:hypothetical protein